MLSLDAADPPTLAREFTDELESCPSVLRRARDMTAAVKKEN